jgi:hypothetical protein
LLDLLVHRQFSQVTGATRTHIHREKRSLTRMRRGWTDKPKQSQLQFLQKANFRRRLSAEAICDCDTCVD